VALKDLKRGFVASNSRCDPAKEATNFIAKVKILPGGNIVRVHRSYTPVMHCHTRQCPVKFTELLEKIELPLMAVL